VQRAILLTSLAAVVIAAVILAGAWALLRPSGPPLAEATLSAAEISPNADGDADAAVLAYRLRRPAVVAIYLENAQGERFYFRRDKPREAGTHTVAFAGVVDPFQLPGDEVAGEILARALPDGDYTWVVAATDAAGARNQFSGRLAIRGADTALPRLQLTVSPPVFTPNQDGLSDRVTINVWLDKDIGEAGLNVYLVDAAGHRLPIAETPGDLRYGERGLHTFDYDGGIDLDLEPPADGEYTVRAEAEDRLGQRLVVTSRLTIANGGLPRADILFGDVAWSATSVVLGETLRFTLTVENYGTAPIRTSGPWSGWEYASMDTNANTLGEYEESGAWRVGVMCQTCQSDYPWRWALGTPESLTLIPDESGQPQYYLMPGERATVTGAIVLDVVVPSRNPQYFWAGLIHEDVEIAAVNNRVGPEYVTILVP
jgi:hypothetical protein